MPSLRVVLVAAGALALVGFVGAAIVSSATQPAYTCDSLLQPPAGAQPGGAETESLGATHVAPGTRLSYGFCPPTSGAHYNAPGAGPLRGGFYAPDSERTPGGWVHNLEHGYVVALYRCDDGGCPDQSELGTLREFLSNAPATPTAQACGIASKTLVARFDSMATRFALLAWGRALLVDEFDPAAARDFAARWIEAASAPEPRAC